MYLLEGLPKSGKSHELVCLTIQYLSEGRDVATTMTLNAEKIYSLLKTKKGKLPGRLFKINRLSDTENFTHGVILIDEAAAFIHARDWSEMTPATRQKFSQHMHDSLDVWLAAQEFETVDPIVRGLLSYCYRLEPETSFFRKGYRMFMFAPSARKINRDNPIGNHFVSLNKKLFDCYNYHELERHGTHPMQEMKNYVVQNQITF